MLSKSQLLRGSVVAALSSFVAVSGVSAQIVLSPAPTSTVGNAVCASDGTIYFANEGDACEDGGTANATTLTIGSGSNTTVIDGLGATFNGFNTFTKNAQFSGVQAFSGTSTFNSTVSFVGPSVTFSTGTTFANGSTFNALADFNAGITSNSITNSGTIATSALTASSVTATGSLIASSGATVDMGGNQVHGVAAGTGDTDAVNVAQLNAATSGISADVTALEATTATHTTQIAGLQSDLATTNSKVAANTAAIDDLNADGAANSSAIAGLQTDVGANTAAIATVQTQTNQNTAAIATVQTQTNANTAAIATNTNSITILQTGLASTQDDVADLQTGLAETNAALGALDDRVDVLAETFDHRLNAVENRADVGTATAVALSGAMYLPGKTFNLTGNVGTYRGAVAGALQMGALVSDSVALNAGVAHGFNKGGKMAARVGFTFGW